MPAASSCSSSRLVLPRCQIRTRSGFSAMTRSTSSRPASPIAGDRSRRRRIVAERGRADQRRAAAGGEDELGQARRERDDALRRPLEDERVAGVVDDGERVGVDGRRAQQPADATSRTPPTRTRAAVRRLMRRSRPVGVRPDDEAARAGQLDRMDRDAEHRAEPVGDEDVVAPAGDDAAACRRSGRRGSRDPRRDRGRAGWRRRRRRPRHGRAAARRGGARGRGRGATPARRGAAAARPGAAPSPARRAGARRRRASARRCRRARSRSRRPRTRSTSGSLRRSSAPRQPASRRCASAAVSRTVAGNGSDQNCGLQARRSASADGAQPASSTPSIADRRRPRSERRRRAPRAATTCRRRSARRRPSARRRRRAGRGRAKSTRLRAAPPARSESAVASSRTAASTSTSRDVRAAAASLIGRAPAARAAWR